MKGFEANDWERAEYVKDPDRKMFKHKKYPFLNIRCRKEQKGFASHTYGKRDPVWSIELDRWSGIGRLKQNYSGRWSDKTLTKFFDMAIKTDKGKQIIFDYLFQGKYDL